jgi:hypothetical protein
LDAAATAPDPLRRAVEIAEVSLGPQHPTSGEALATYSIALRKSGRKKEARQMDVRAKAIRAAIRTTKQA